ncbi:MAG: hypothetical protein REI78_11060 [Pedobacter sp.]|nr:hypothetical protein [Pedobacter sp.]MDQ8053560.1 hypothetical protein [Pedobacter sp.]
MKLFKSFLILILLVFSGSCFAQRKFTGTFSNGYTGGKLSFVLSPDGKQIQKFTFNGYWRCGGSTEHITAGPESSFAVVNGKIKATIAEPENGGSSAFRFNLEGAVSGKQANGVFRMSITGLACDTYNLNWTAKSN